VCVTGTFSTARHCPSTASVRGLFKARDAGFANFRPNSPPCRVASGLARPACSHQVFLFRRGNGMEMEGRSIECRRHGMLRLPSSIREGVDRRRAVWRYV